jgi:hypothetical protein
MNLLVGSWDLNCKNPKKINNNVLWVGLVLMTEPTFLISGGI